MSEVELCDEMIEFEVCNSRTLRSNMRIGTFKIDLGYIYDQKQHSINRKWLLLSDEDDPSIGAKGFLKVSINIIGPGDEPPVWTLVYAFWTSYFICFQTHDNEDESDDIESNLLKTVGLILRPATFILKLYKAEDLPRSLHRKY